MKHTLLLLLLIALVRGQAIHADLWLIQYEPTVFKLHFSEKIQRPEFQIMFNNIVELNYHFLSPEEYSDVFFMQIDDQEIISDQTLQSYEILFNSPLKIGNGRLGVNYFVLQSQKKIIEISFNRAIGIFVSICAYLLLNFTLLGNVAMQFLQIYCLMMFRNQTKTQLYHEISTSMFLLNPVLDDGTYVNESTIYFIICTPMFLVIASGFIGFIVKRAFSCKKSVVSKIFYEIVVYDIFVNIGVTFVFTLFFNALEFYSLTSTGLIKKGTSLYLFGHIYSYFNLITTVAVIYLFIYVLNPKPKEDQQSWKKYILSEQFHGFHKLHEMTYLTPWYKRNKRIMIIFKRLLLACLFYWQIGFEGMVLMMQFVTIFYIFTVQPYKEEKFMNMTILCRLLMLIFYILVMLGNLYFSLGNITMNYQSVKKYLITRDSIFLVIIFAILSFVIYEMYHKFSNLNYQIRLVKEQNEYKIQITEKEKQKADSDILSRKERNRSYAYSDEMEAKVSRVTVFNEDQVLKSKSPSREVNRTSHDRNARKTESSKKYEKSMSSSVKESNRLGSKTKYQVQMDNLAARPRVDSIGTNQSDKTRKTKREKMKWRKQSLLVQILQEK